MCLTYGPIARFLQSVMSGDDLEALDMDSFMTGSAALDLNESEDVVNMLLASLPEDGEVEGVHVSCTSPDGSLKAVRFSVFSLQQHILQKIPDVTQSPNTYRFYHNSVVLSAWLPLLASFFVVIYDTSTTSSTAIIRDPYKTTLMAVHYGLSKTF